MNTTWLRIMPVVLLVPISGSTQVRPDPWGTIQGVVVDSETGQPISGAQVGLARSYHVFGREGVASAKADNRGVFTISAAPNEYYFLSARKAGYLHGEAVSEPKMFSLEAREKLTGLVLQLSREGVIRGRLTDADGDLVARTEIAVWQWRFAGGDRYLAPQIQGARVWPDGSFRIDNLSAGTVYLQALRRWEPADYGGQPRLDASAPTFYRDAADVPSAEPIKITRGALIEGIELRMRRAMLYRVQGEVSGPAGMEQTALRFCAPGMRHSCLPVVLRADGHFAIDNVPAGDYEVEGNALMRTPQLHTMRASQLAHVKDRLGDVRVTYFPVPEVKSTVHGGDGGFHLLAEGRYAETLRHGHSGNGEMQSVRVYPGRYRAATDSLPEGLFVDSIRAAGKEVSGGFELGAAGITLEIVLASGAAKLSGTLRDGPSSLLEDIPVTVWSEANGPRNFVRTTMVNADGWFELGNLPPGQYRIAAWEGISEGMAQYRGFFEAFAKDAVSVNLATGEIRKIGITPISRKAGAAQADKVR